MARTTEIFGPKVSSESFEESSSKCGLLLQSVWQSSEYTMKKSLNKSSYKRYSIGGWLIRKS